MRRILVAAVAVAALAGCGGSGRQATRGPEADDATRSATAAAYAFLDRYVTPDGRVRRRDQGDDTVGEGQAYAMLAAAAVGDEARFDRVWHWTTAHLRRADGLLAFRWAAGRVVDPQAATDADLDAARALLVAACRLDRPDLREDGLALGRAILSGEVARQDGRSVLAAGPWATRGRTVINPSYFAPGALRALREASGDAEYTRVADGTRAALRTLRAPLPPDWAMLNPDGTLRPVAQASGDGGEGRYTFDAPRTLLRLSEDSDPAGRSLAARAWRVLRRAPMAPLLVERTLDGEPAGSARHPVAPVGAAGAANAAGDDAAVLGLLDAAERLQRSAPTYYGAAMVALGRLTLTTRLLRPQCHDEP